MGKIPKVEEAKALMTEAAAWSVMKWLREKKRVRKIADEANAALDDSERKVKAGWSSEVASAYKELGHNTGSQLERSNARLQTKDSKIRQFVLQVKEADDQASKAREDAERTFDQAERLLSTALAREGCRKAVHSWELHERAICRAEES